MFWLIQRWVQLVKEPYVVYLAMRDPRVRPRSKVIAALATVLLLFYIVDPVDLLPDFSLFGFLDDLILIPLTTYLIEKLIPKPVLTESRAKARKTFGPIETVFTAIAIFVLLLIILAIAAIIYVIWRLVKG